MILESENPPALNGNIITNYLLRSPLSGDNITNYPMCSTLLVDIAIGYPLYRQPLGSACRYCNWLSALPTICSALPIDIAISYPLYGNPLGSVWRHIQPTIRCSVYRSALYCGTTTNYWLYYVCCTTTEYSLCFACRYLQSAIRSTLYGNTTTDYALYFACRYCIQLSPLDSVWRHIQPTIRSSDYPLCSALRHYDKLSALLWLAALQPTIRCVLLCMATV
jgi:hypothetical protein